MKRYHSVALIGCDKITFGMSISQKSLLIFKMSLSCNYIYFFGKIDRESSGE